MVRRNIPKSRRKSTNMLHQVFSHALGNNNFCRSWIVFTTSLIRLTEINIFRRYLYIQLASFPVAYCCTLARELARQSDIPMLEKGLDHQFDVLAQISDASISRRRAGGLSFVPMRKLGRRTCLLVTDHEDL